MASHVRLFLKLLHAELEDLAEDIELIDQLGLKRFQENKISSYVYKENDALLRRELDSIANLSKIVDAIDATLYKNVDELEAELLKRLREQVARFEEPEAIVVFLQRKLDKIHAYLTSGEALPGRP
jgi:predicted mannosyl-3-phosphoglycerate phosphatase (HAD superfamily)